MQSSHVTALQTKHAGLESQLRSEMKRPVPDDMTIKQLKQKKLKLKEELAAF